MTVLLLAEKEGFNLRCGGGHLAALESPGTPFTTDRVRIPTGVLPNNKTCHKGRLCYLANDCYFDKNTHIVQFRNTDIVFPFWF